MQGICQQFSTALHIDTALHQLAGGDVVLDPLNLGKVIKKDLPPAPQLLDPMLDANSNKQAA